MYLDSVFKLKKINLMSLSEQQNRSLMADVWHLYQNNHIGRGFPFRRMAKKYFRCQTTAKEKDQLKIYVRKTLRNGRFSR